MGIFNTVSPCLFFLRTHDYCIPGTVRLSKIRKIRVGRGCDGARDGAAGGGAAGGGAEGGGAAGWGR